MSPVAWAFLAAFSVGLTAVGFVIVTLSNVDLAERLRKANQRIVFLAEQRTFLATQRDRLADVCEALTGELQENDLMRIKQARKSNAQQERIAELEARELPQLHEIRSRAAAHGSQWGPS